MNNKHKKKSFVTYTNARIDFVLQIYNPKKVKSGFMDSEGLGHFNSHAERIYIISNSLAKIKQNSNKKNKIGRNVKL